MAYIWEQFSTDPAENNKAAPYGAPEGQVQINLFTDICRVMMASIREVADIAITTGGKVGTLGIQNKESVNIVGGNIKTTVVDNCYIVGGTQQFTVVNANSYIDAAALKQGIMPFARMPLQALYNAVHPVGTRKIYILPDSADLYWAGISAQWAWFPDPSGHLLVVASDNPTVSAGTGTIRVGIHQITTSGAAGQGPIPTGLNGAVPAAEHNHTVHTDFLRYGIGIAIRVA